MNEFYKKTSLLVLLIIGVVCQAYTLEGYRIGVRIHGVSDTIAILAYHHGNRQLVKDTVRVDTKGKFTFTGSELLPGGIYIVVLPDQEFFEFLVDKNQNFSMEATRNNIVNTIEFDNSPDNEAFYEYIRFIARKNEVLTPVRVELQEKSLDENRKQELQDELRAANQAVKARQDEIIARFEGSLLASMLRAQQDVPMPATRLKPDGTVDHEYMYQQYKRNFLNNVDFSDERLIRTPVLHSRLHQFFNNVLMQIPDSIIAEADIILQRARANREVFRFTLTYITQNFERSQIMGMDAVFVHMVEQYYMKGDADWLTDQQLQRIVQRAMAIKPTLIGKVAPDISMFKPDGSMLNLHSIDAKFTVLYFWDSECSHCRRNTPLLIDFYQRMKPKGVEIFSVNTEADRQNWLNYVTQHGLNWINVNDPFNQSGYREKYDIWSTPLLFVLDANKKILAKKINVQQAEEIINSKLQTTDE